VARHRVDAVGLDAVTGSAFDDIGPALGGRRVAGQRVEPSPEQGHRRVPAGEVVALEPVEPPLEGGQLTGDVGGQRDVDDQPGGSVGVAGQHGVVDGGRAEVAAFAPLGGPPGQLAGKIRLLAFQLDAE